MIIRRLGAVVAAAALIVGALFVRRELDDDDAAATDEPDPARATTELVCITELSDVCETLEGDFSITIEDAGATLDRLGALADPADAPVWLTIDPYPAMVDELRRGAGLDPVAADTTPVGSTAPAIAVPGDAQAEVLTSGCADAPLWRCIGDRAGDEWTELGGEAQWSAIEPSLGDVEGSATALASFANAVAGYLGDADVSRSRWELDPNFSRWLRGLARTVPASDLSSGTPLATMITRDSLVDVAATTNAEIDALGAPAADAGIRYPEPSMSAEAVLAVPSGRSAPDDLAGELADALAEAGWEPPSSAGTALPEAGVMIALRDVWAETA